MITVTLVFRTFLIYNVCSIEVFSFFLPTTTWPIRVCAATEMESEPADLDLQHAPLLIKLQARPSANSGEEYSSTSRNIVVVVRVCVFMYVCLWARSHWDRLLLLH